jgi:hypothetical protein
MGGSRREATEAVALGRESERRRGLRWREPTRQTRRRWRRGEELRLRRRREEHVKKRERPTAFQAPRWRGVARGERRGPYRHGHMEGEGGEGSRAWRSTARGGQQCPRPSGAGGGAVVQQGKTAGAVDTVWARLMRDVFMNERKELESD